MEGVPDNLVPLIMITSQPKEERTWVSISRKLLTEKIQSTFCLFCLIPWRPKWRGTCWTRAMHAGCTEILTEQRDLRRFRSKSSLASVHPHLSFLSGCLGAEVLLWGVTEWSWVCSSIWGDPGSNLLYLRGMFHPLRFGLDALSSLPWGSTT